ncbi:MAG: hypothetical protein RMM58_09195 [Chloroflexota bacterium]|nr:hypothetical protein [Dehalococcoidia bacterium]MDW8254041.1 hypothetical protein [Chloroflexota bacterium]
MTTIAVLPPANELGDRVDWWLSREHQVTRCLDSRAPLTIYIVNQDPAHDHALIASIRRASPQGWLIVTGDADQAPRWVARLASRDRHVVAVFPAAPAVLQVTVRSILNREPTPSA